MVLSSQFLLCIVLGVYGFGALSAIVSRKHEALTRYLSFGVASVAGSLGIVLALRILSNGETIAIVLKTHTPFLDIAFKVDGLSAFMILVMSVLGLAVSVYSIGYTKVYSGRFSVGYLGSLYNLFLLSMVFVVTADNGLMFLMAWEVMSLVSYFLVVYENDNPMNVSAGLIYLIMTHVGTAFIIMAFITLFGHTGSFGFDSFRSLGPGIPDHTRDLVFLMALLGFGVKAGIIPLHIWLPKAHPAAPSNVSALMSGVMIKTGIYGLFRVVFDFLGVGDWWWGFLVMALASISALLGVMYALMEHDIKRLLAYHSVENIGIILLGIGAAMVLSFYGHDALAGMAAIAGFYHLLNHAVFKGLLFLGAGSVVHSVHSRNIEDMGGLIKRMPYTALFFLIGAASISALPPLNGFISEWLTFQSLLLGISVSEPTVRVFLPVFIALLAISGALAAACFVKVFGVAFLALPRSRGAEEAKEVGISMRLGMGLLAILCLVLGVLPFSVIALLDGFTSPYFGSVIKPMFADYFTVVPIVEGFSNYAPLPLLAVLLLLIPLPYFLSRMFFSRCDTRKGPTWDCGIPEVTPRMEYTATAFSNPINIIFKIIYRPVQALEISHITPYFKGAIKYESRVDSVFESYFYNRVGPLLIKAAHKVSRIQTGSIHSYLAFMFAALVTVLVVGGRYL